jgi:hypothetical protein
MLVLIMTPLYEIYFYMERSQNIRNLPALLTLNRP